MLGGSGDKDPRVSVCVPTSCVWVWCAFNAIKTWMTREGQRKRDEERRKSEGERCEGNRGK